MEAAEAGSEETAKRWERAHEHPNDAEELAEEKR